MLMHAQRRLYIGPADYAIGQTCPTGTPVEKFVHQEEAYKERIVEKSHRNAEDERLPTVLRKDEGKSQGADGKEEDLPKAREKSRPIKTDFKTKFKKDHHEGLHQMKL